MGSTNHLLAHNVVSQLRACGHFLYYRMGGRAGRQRILIVLSRYEEILQKDLQDLLQIQSGSLSEVIIRLEAEGLLEKGKSKTDGRQLSLRLTAKGRQEAEEMKRKYEAQISKMMACFTEEELLTLNDLLGTMLAHWHTMDTPQGSKPPKKAR